MSLINAADLPDHQMVSVVIPGIHSDYANHSPLSVLDVTQGGQKFEIHIYRGKRFSDSSGDTFTPLGFLTLREYQLFKPLLGGVDESGNEIPRRLFVEWEKISFTVTFMRKLQSSEFDNTEIAAAVPAEMTDAANLAIELICGPTWNINNLPTYPNNSYEEIADE